MSYRNCLMAAAFVASAVPIAAADCFDRTLAIARYHYVNPGSIANNWQDIYEISLSGGAVSAVTRLTKGAIMPPRYDSSSPAYSPDGARIAYVESDAGGTNARLKVMDAADSDNDLEGDNASILDATDVDISVVAWGANNLLAYGKFDEAENTQIATATLSGSTLGPVMLHTSDADYPDSFSFVADDELIYDADGRYLKHIDLSNNVVTTLSGLNPIDRQPTGKMVGGDVFFSRVVGGTLDIWRAQLAAGPTLQSAAPFLATTDLIEVSAMLSDDGACLAYLAADLTITYGPNSDLWVRDLATGQSRQITQTRDLAAVAWKP